MFGINFDGGKAQFVCLAISVSTLICWVLLAWFQEEVVCLTAEELLPQVSTLDLLLELNSRFSLNIVPIGLFGASIVVGIVYISIRLIFFVFTVYDCFSVVRKIVMKYCINKYLEFRAIFRLQNAIENGHMEVFGGTEQPEKILTSSVFDTKPEPNCQVCFTTNEAIPHGIATGFRVMNYIVTANHVVSGMGMLRIVKGLNSIVVEGSDFVDLGFDVAAVRLSQAQFSVLGVGKANMPKMAVMGRKTVTINAFGKSSTATMVADVDRPYVTYQGDTVAGFSGAPYIECNVAVAIHTGAGSNFNIGIDMNYVATCLSKSEATTDFIDKEIKKAIKTGQRIPYVAGFDRVKLFVQGQYFDVEKDEYENLWDALENEPEEFDRNKIHKKFRKFEKESIPIVTYDDVEPELIEEVPAPKNLKMAPVHAGASSYKPGKVVRNQSRKRWLETRKYSGVRTSTVSTVGLRPDLVMPKDPSPCIVELPKNAQGNLLSQGYNLSPMQSQQCRTALLA